MEKLIHPLEDIHSTITCEIYQSLEMSFENRTISVKKSSILEM